MAIFLAIGFLVYHYNVNPLAISLDTPAHTLQDYIKPNEILVVSFWASWCPHCINEINTLKKFKQLHPEIAILGLKVDETNPGDIIHNTGYPSLDASLHGAQIMQLFGNYTAALPFTIIFKNKNSKTLLGETSAEELEQNISALQRIPSL